MAISDSLAELATDISNAYDSIENKGGTLPQNKNTNNLATAIDSIQTGITPSGTIQITENGTHDVTQYATADVNVRSWLYYATSLQGMFNSKRGNTDINLGIPEKMNLGYLNNCVDINSIFSCYIGHTYNVPNPKEVIMEINPLNTVDCTCAFNRRTCLEKVTFIGGIKFSSNTYNVFRDCSNLKSIIGAIDGTLMSRWVPTGIGNSNCFSGCSKLEDIEFKAETINASIDFSVTSKLSAVSIQSIIDGLETITTAKTITFSALLVNPLTSQQEAEIQAKGWTLAYA